MDEHMSDDISTFLLSNLFAACSEQTEHFKQGRSSDPRYCLEIFRRAIVAHDDAAWESLHRIYTPLVKNWLLRSAASLVETARQHQETALDDAIQDGFIQFYYQFYAQKLQFSAFDLPGLIRYLEKCAWSVLLHQTTRSIPTYPLEAHAQQMAPPDDVVLTSMRVAALLDAIQQRITPQEWQLLELRYMENIKTSEAAERVGMPVQAAYRLLPKLRHMLANDQHMRLLYQQWTQSE
jgi:RNA polymerase sigma factor (sigma-70 family)